MFYGISKSQDIGKLASEIVEIFGGDFNTVCMLVETAAAETLCGSAVDYTRGSKYGVGLTQFDQIGFDDVKQRTADHRIALFEDTFGADWDDLSLASLEFSPAIALAFTRLKYILIPAPIPTTLEGRAKYWKSHYNSSLGKGTSQEYVDRCWDSIPQRWEFWQQFLEIQRDGS